MKCPTMASFPTRCVTTLQLTLLSLVSQLMGQNADGRPAGAIHLSVQVEKSTYHLGDLIRVRVGGTDASFLSSPALVRLRVYDAVGQRVEPAKPHSLVMVDGSNSRLSAASRSKLHDNAWVNLRDWGYDLRVPGRYSIVAFPMPSDRNLTLDFEKLRSNEVTFTIMR